MGERGGERGGGVRGVGGGGLSVYEKPILHRMSCFVLDSGFKKNHTLPGMYSTLSTTQKGVDHAIDSLLRFRIPDIALPG